MKPRQFSRINPDTLVLIKQILVGVLVIALVGMLLTGIWYGSRIQALTIDSVVVTGGETINLQTIESAVWEQLDGVYIGLIPRRFAWTYPQSDIEAALSEIERIHNIDITRTRRTEISVTFDEYIPTALWCADIASEDCVFVDRAGFAFAPAPGLTGGSFLRFARIGEGYELRTSVIEQDLFDQLLLTVQLLAQQGWFVSQIEIDTAGDAFLQVGGGGELKITLRQTPEQTVDNLRTVLAADEFTHIAPGNFQYIDLRYGNKVFVNEELEVEDSLQVDEDAALDGELETATSSSEAAVE